MTDLAAVYRRHFTDDPRRERGFLSAAGFTTAFATARAITHSIRAGIGPFHNVSAKSVSSALTLDEFALWLDLKDDYRDQQGRKSIDAVAIFGGLLTMGLLAQDAVKDLLGLEHRAEHVL